MADVFGSAKRSDVMSRIRSSGNRSTELRMIAIFNFLRIKGWRRNYPVVGKPDFVFLQKRCAIFVDGCFWHGCPEHGSVPNTNSDYWSKKITRNRQRDRMINARFRKRNWRVIRIWEHELKRSNQKNLRRRLMRALASDRT